MFISRNVSASGETNPFAVVSSPPPAGDETETTPPPLEVLLEHGLIRPKPKPASKEPSAENQAEKGASQAQQASRRRLEKHTCDSDDCLAGSPSLYEEDHLIPLELGGAPRNPKNLWPEPRTQAKISDPLETNLKRAVCRGLMRLVTARAAIRKFKFANG